MKRKNLIVGIIFFIFFILFLVTGSWLNQNERSILLDSVVDVAVTSAGDYWITDMGGRRILSTDKNLKVKQVLQTTDPVKQITVNDKDEIFLKKVTIRNQNNSIAEESIWKIQKNREKMKKVYERKYDSSRLRAEIFDISGKGSDLILGIKEQNGFGFYQLDNNGVLTQLVFKPFEEADVWINSGVFLEDEQRIYYCLQNGTIYEYDIEEKKETQIYNGALLKKREGVPGNLTKDRQNNIYFTDLGLRDIGWITEGEVSYLTGNNELEQEEFLQKESYIKVKVDKEVVACSSYAIYLQKEGQLSPYYELEVGQKGVIYSWLSKISLGVMASIILFYTIVFLRYIIKYKDITSRLMLILCMVIGGMTLLLLVMVIPDYKSQMMKELEYRTKNVAYLTAENIPSEVLLKLDSVADFRTKDYNALKTIIDKIFLREDGVQDFYCTIYTVRDDIIAINYSSEESNGSYYPYDWTYEGSDEEEIIQTGVGKVYTSYLNSDGNYTFSLYPIKKENLGVIGLVEVGVNTQLYEEHINDLILDLLITMMVASVVIVFIILEVLVFFKGNRKLEVKRGEFIPNEILRTLVFLIFLVTNIATSFLPIYALNLVHNTSQGLSGEIWASIVISAEVFAGAVLSLKGNILLHRLGQRKAVLLSGVVMFLGMLLRVIPNIFILILAQFLIGAGWGVILLMVNTRISRNEEEKDEGFAGYSAAAFNGINCGVVLGGFAMNFMSYRSIILTAAIISVLILFHLWKFIDNEKQSEVNKEKGEISTIYYLTRRRVWTFLLFLVLPVIACGYYLNYLYPILANQRGIQESYIGYSYLINGMVVLAMGNLLTKEVVRWMGRKIGLVISVVIYAVAFFLVSSVESIPVLFLSLLLLGLADSFGLPLQSSYFMDLEETKEFGYEKAAGIYSLVENLAQSAGPLMFGYILIFGLSRGLKILALGVIVLALGFLLLSIKFKNKGKEENR